MPSVKPDIKAIADRDPVMRELLGHQAYFLYKDWQLFRERKPLELVRRLERRAGRGFVVFSVLTVLAVAIGLPTLLLEPPSADSFYAINLARTVLYAGGSAWMTRHMYLARKSFRDLAERLESR